METLKLIYIVSISTNISVLVGLLWWTFLVAKVDPSSIDADDLDKFKSPLNWVGFLGLAPLMVPSTIIGLCTFCAAARKDRDFQCAEPSATDSPFEKELTLINEEFRRNVAEGHRLHMEEIAKIGKEFNV